MRFKGFTALLASTALCACLGACEMASAQIVPDHTNSTLVIESDGLAPPPPGVLPVAITTRDASAWRLTGDGRLLNTGYVPGQRAFNLRLSAYAIGSEIHYQMEYSVDLRYGPPGANLWATGGDRPLFIDAYTDAIDPSAPTDYGVFSTIEHPDTHLVEGPLPQFNAIDGYVVNDLVSRNTRVFSHWVGTTFVVEIRDPSAGRRSDFNHSGQIGVQDIFDFIGAYCEDNPTADYNHDHLVGPDDLMDFLGDWFVGD